MIILDTDAVTFLEIRESRISQRLQDRLTIESADHRIVTTIVSYEEQTRGWLAWFAKARDTEAVVRAYTKLMAHVNTYRELDILPLTLNCEQRFRQLRSQKIRIGTHDLRIAAIALEHDAVLYTRNLSDFKQVPGLRIVDWMQD